MAKVKLGVDRLKILEKVALARQIVTKLTGNAVFTTPVPPLAVVGAAATALETAYNDAQAAQVTSKQKTAVQATQEEALDKLLAQLAVYVESASGGEESKILSAGMSVRTSTPTAIGTPAQVQALAATAGDNEGEIDLVWDPAAGAKSYSIELSTTSGTGPWTPSRVVTKSSATVGNLTPGARVWFRVTAIGTEGNSPWSDPATKIVP